MNKTPKPIRMFLIRHGEAQHNVDIGVLREGVDANSGLTPHGWEQAVNCGKFLEAFFMKTPPEGEAIVLTSSYERCLQTTQGIFESIGHRVSDAYPVHAFTEQNFGDVNGFNRNQQETSFPQFAKLETLYHANNAAFFLRYPGGESLSDVCARVRGKFGDIHRWHERGATDIIIVTHSRTLRCIATEWMNLDYRSMFGEKPPSNCAIRLIDKGSDKGYIFNNGVEVSSSPIARSTSLDSLKSGHYRPPFLKSGLE